MGCTGSALRCCPAGGKRQLKAQQQREPASQELTALKTENANATLLPEDGKEKAALREERTESTRLLQGQEEEEKRLRDASRAGTARITQDINNQVGRKGGCCWGQRPGRERVAGWDFPGSDHGPGTGWAGLSCFQEKECVRKGLGSLERSGNESLGVGRARASLMLGQMCRVCHLPASQVEKGKDLEEQFDALRREHTETLQELQRAHEQEKVLLAESYHRSQAALQETIQVLNSQLKSFQERMKRVEESLLSTDYKKHIQEHGSPSPFWEQELESLHFVIEMKNEHIHSLDKKLLNLETVVERNLLLEEKVKTLQQENEDLQVRTQNHLVMARQLSEELLAARGALEKEAQLREQARHEKEELLYRVLNGGDGTPFPIAASEVPLIAT
ncbi:coiled-coil domain-containing protein 69 isoform 1-T1 [Morphnus guianensis]